MPNKTKAALRGKPFTKGDPRAGRPKGVRNKASLEVKEIARQLVEDPAYRDILAKRLKVGHAPQMETLLWHYAYGKPTETVELSGQISVSPNHDLSKLSEAELRELERLLSKATPTAAGAPGGN